MPGELASPLPATPTWYARQLSELPAVAPATPAGKKLHAARHTSSLGYCRLAPVHVVCTAVQYAAHVAATPPDEDDPPALPLTPLDGREELPGTPDDPPVLLAREDVAAPEELLLVLVLSDVVVGQPLIRSARSADPAATTGRLP